MKRKILIITLLSVAVLYGCKKNPITNRRQVQFFPESQMIGMSATAYGDFLTQNQQNVLPQTDPRAARVTEIGVKMTTAVRSYLTDIGHVDLIEGFDWQYNTVEDPTINAWCMPGGRIVFYTGILDLSENDDEIAVIMGHEIAHAVAGHGNERMSQATLAQGITSAAGFLAMTDTDPGLAKSILLQSVGMGSQLGMLKFGRKHESESDEMGLIFMNRAGYDPYAAVNFWTKMSQQGSGQKPPEILSTHPSDERRISDIQAILIKMETSGEINSKKK